jgi:predicted phosphodiesterase
MADKFSSSPDRLRVHEALTHLLEEIVINPGKKGELISFEAATGKWIIFSDQHKGAKNGADDFMGCEKNYLAALEFYNREGFRFISLGDNEELWENTLASVKEKNEPSFSMEKLFLQRNDFLKVFGNHDLYWANDPLAPWQLKRIFGQQVRIYEGVILQTTIGNGELKIFLTHGHQGDLQSDGNWFSKWFVSNVWGPLQSYLRINPNTPSCNEVLKTRHNSIMYEWSASQEELILITGHTHQPVFESLTHLEKLYRALAEARNDHDQKKEQELLKVISQKFDQESEKVYKEFLNLRPSYFNSGCCCFSDGDITGIEIANNRISLIKWTWDNGGSSRVVLEERELTELAGRL